MESFLKYPSELGDKSGEDVVDEVSTNTYELELEEPQTFARRSEEVSFINNALILNVRTFCRKIHFSKYLLH